MEPQNNFDIEEKLQELEKEINESNPPEVKQESPATPSTFSDRFLEWLKDLPKSGQVAVFMGASHICRKTFFAIPNSPFPIPKKRSIIGSLQN